MKNKWYFGYIIAAISLILLFTVDTSSALEVVLIIVFAVSLSISYVNINHKKMMENDKDYRISVNDERNEKIKDKVNSTMSAILMAMMGVIAIISIATRNYIPPGILLFVCILISPIIMHFINSYYEKLY